MSDIEAEIRRQMLEERDRALRNETPPQSGPTPGSAFPPATGSFESSFSPNGSSYHALPPPAFPQVGPAYPPYYASPTNTPFSLAQQPEPSALPPPTSSSASKSPPRGGWWGGLGAAGIGLAKFGGALKFLTFGKYFVTAGSMLVSVVLSAAYYGWWLGLGVVLLIFLHELGHVFAVKRLGYRVSAMVFLPFMGAYVQHERTRSTSDTAQIAIMGPVAGMLGGLACGAIYGMTGNAFWLYLSYFSFYLNLFNLSAIPFLDGGHVTPLIPSKILLAGLLGNLLINFRSPICWLLLLFALPQITEGWRQNRVDPSLGVSKQDQQNYTLAYFGLVVLMGFAAITTQSWLWELRHLARHI